MLVGRVFVWVRDLGGFAEAAYVHAVPGSDEEGGDGCEEDVAVGGVLVGGVGGADEPLEWEGFCREEGG